jgi:hypothetical protein
MRQHDQARPFRTREGFRRQCGSRQLPKPRQLEVAGISSKEISFTNPFLLSLPLILLKRALQRVSALLCKIHHLCHFGFGDFIGKYAAHADAFLVDVEHNSGCGVGVHLEKCFEYMDDEFHRGVIVVEQQDFIQAGLFGFGPCTRGKADTRAAAFAATVIIVPVVIVPVIILVRAHFYNHARKIG